MKLQLCDRFHTDRSAASGKPQQPARQQFDDEEAECLFAAVGYSQFHAAEYLNANNESMKMRLRLGEARSPCIPAPHLEPKVKALTSASHCT
ncbi:hypothetical protein AAFF_G00035580 [Aldrovandia affinis]|uniref:Uncharacterized protein n=1 Tax=Aldrovandia affinis TaxID=143900 RepID=A0AAD7S344_9TELE|nr:hypothetical protein AAFF_G00035580 [Aldrovandia affinis]